jgi:hypothetical protein
LKPERIVDGSSAGMHQLSSSISLQYAIGDTGDARSQ